MTRATPPAPAPSAPPATRPFLWVDGGEPPPLGRSVRRRLARAETAIAERGVRRVFRFDSDPRVITGLHGPVTAAMTARNRSADPPRPVDYDEWEATWRQATTVATLWLDGVLAAWNLAAPCPPAWLVLAGQMVPGHEWAEPGRMLERELIRRAFADQRYLWVDWGSWRHASSLIAVSVA